MTAGEIAERFPLAQSTLSGHFNILKNAGLIVAEKNGTSIRLQSQRVGRRANDGGGDGSARRRQTAEKEQVMKLSWRVELPQLLDRSRRCSRWPRWAWPQLPERLPVHWNIQRRGRRLGRQVRWACC